MRRSNRPVRTPARGLSVAVAVAMVAMLALMLTAPPASAAWLGKARKTNSPAVLVASVDKRGATETDVWSFDLGTDGSVKLDTNYSPRGKAYNDSPTFSPEGGPHIVYVGKSGPNAADGDLFVVDRDTPGLKGVDPQNITATRILDGDAENPAWSPSGGKIAFDFTPTGQTDAQLWWSSLSGATQQPITCCDARAVAGPGRGIGQDEVVKGTDPAWSPNSNWIAFTKHASVVGVGDVKQLWVTSFSGKRPLDALPDGPIQIPIGLGEQPNWSPLGDRIAFVNGGSLYVIRFSPLGFRNQTPVLIDTPPAGYVDESPAWSPDSYDTAHGVLVFDRRPASDNSTDAKQLYQVDPNALRAQPQAIDTRDGDPGFFAGNADWWPQCTNDKATSDGKIIEGTSGPDLLCGGDGSSTFDAMGGDDRIYAGAGKDVINAGPGDDFMLAGVGTVGDKINGGAGDDHIEGSQADDFIIDTGSKSGRDDIHGEGGNDVINANDGIKGNDRVDGGDGVDTCTVDNQPPGDVPAVDFVFGCESVSVGRKTAIVEFQTFGPG